MASSRAGLRVFSLIAMSGGAFAYSSHGSDSLLPSVVEPNATALPTERGPLFAPSHAGPMPDAVDPRWTTFKTAFEALDVESGGIVLSAENQQLLEKVLQRMIEFAGLIQEEKERILYMSSPAGRRRAESLQPKAIAVLPHDHSCFGLDSLPPSSANGGRGDAKPAEDKATADQKLAQLKGEAAFEEEFGKAYTLDYRGLGWMNTEAAQLAEVLASGAAPRLEALDLRYNKIGDKGCKALAAALGKEGAAPRLETLDLGDNKIGDKGCIALAAALKEGAAPRLKELTLDDNKIGDEGWTALAAALKEGAAPSLKTLIVDRKPRELKAVCEERGIRLLG